MAPLIPSAKTTLLYPLWACDFDPLDATRLVVGGGGGAGKSGVGNKITLLDATNPNELAEIGAVDLSKDEDNVASLAVGQRKGKSTIVFAGVNSGPQDLQNGKNDHFRVFGIEATKGKGKIEKAANKISEISRSTLFDDPDKNLYQRIVRLSKPYPNQSQFGAVATGLAKKPKIVLFNTSTSPPKPIDTEQLKNEPEDTDFIQIGEDQYVFAYCTGHEIYTKKVSSKTGVEELKCIYVIPASDSFDKPTVPTFRAMRWLTKDFILMLTNIHGNGGVVLQILQLPPNGRGRCRISQSLRLPSSITKATGLAVSNLTPPPTPDVPQGYTQFVIAVAGHDRSISLFKADLQQEGVYAITCPKAFRTFKGVHPLQITSLAFSNFMPPARRITAGTPPQYLKLASVGVSNTVVVHTLPLFPVPFSVKKGQSRTPRYVVALPSSKAVFGAGIILSIFVALFGALILQTVLEVRGGVHPYLGAKDYLPAEWQETIAKSYVFSGNHLKKGEKVNLPGSHHHLGVPEIFGHLKKDGKEGVVVVKEEAEGNVDAVLHENHMGEHGGKKWEELSPEQKVEWKKKLSQAGHWAEEMGETILKGVVFGELAGAIGDAARG